MSDLQSEGHKLCKADPARLIPCHPSVTVRAQMPTFEVLQVDLLKKSMEFRTGKFRLCRSG